MKRILLLGATGSIGLQTVDVIEQHPDQFSWYCGWTSSGCNAENH